MAEFERGQFFFDKQATNFQGVKGKYFIALTEATEADDMIVCFVINTENNFPKYSLNCNRFVQKFILAPGQFSFVAKHSSIMLSLPCRYTFEEICNSNINILTDIADDNLCRQIKNCIEMDQIEPLFSSALKNCYKNSPPKKT